jgi:hypothetical protein
VRHLANAIETAGRSHPGKPIRHPWYFSSIVEFGLALHEHRLELAQAAMADRLTTLSTQRASRSYLLFMSSGLGNS